LPLLHNASLPTGLPIFASKLWELFELCELEGNQRAARDPSWAALLARVRVGKHTKEDEKVLASLVLTKASKRKPAPGAIHLYATRAAVATCNRNYINQYVQGINGVLYDCPAVDISVSSGAPLPPEKAWPLAEDTGGLESLLMLAEGAEVMLRKNLDVQDGLVNGARGIVQHIDTHGNGEVERVWVKFEKGAGSKYQAATETTSVAIRRCSASWQDKDGNKAERRQFPLVLAKATTIHKSQAATYHAGVHARLDKHVQQEGQAYVALSRAPTQELCTLERFDRESLKFNANAEWALTTLKARQAKSTGPSKQALQELWQQAIKPAQSTTHYQLQLAHMEPPNWKTYAEEQRAKGAPEKTGGKSGTLTCPRCGWTADDADGYKKHKATCPAKKPRQPKAKAKAKAEAKAKAKAKPKPKASPKKRPADAPATEQPPAKASKAERFPMSDPDVDPPLPPPADPPPDDLPPPAQCFFFQRQEAAHCGMHALNNALGEALFTPAAMMTAAESYLQEMQGIDDARDEHIRAGGWYSVQVLYTAVFAKGLALDFHAPLQTLDEAQQAAALIQNWSNHHWVAYRWGNDGEIYRLDSMQLGPSKVSEAEFAASMVAHWTYAVKRPGEGP
jgi:hypothetical protein